MCLIKRVTCVVAKPMEFRQAIETKFMGPTNTKGSRVKASCAAGSLIVQWQHELNSDENHLRAAKLLQTKLNWDKYNRLHGGVLKSGVYVFVQNARRNDRNEGD